MWTLKEINEKLRNGNFTERNVAMSILADYAEQEEQGLLITLDPDEQWLICEALKDYRFYTDETCIPNLIKKFWYEKGAPHD